MKIQCEILCLSLFFLVGCVAFEPDIPDGYNSYQKGNSPEVAIQVRGLSANKAVFDVFIKSTGGRKLTRLCLCLNETKALPDTLDYVVDVIGQYIPGIDTFQIALPDLEVATGYYCRAFVANSDESAYTNAVAFTTKVASNNFSWEAVADLPVTGALYYNAFTVDNRAFAFSSFYDWTWQEGGELMEFLPASNQWVQRGRLPWADRSLPVSVVCADKAYVGFGDICRRNEDGSTTYFAQQDWWCYAPQTGYWERRADIPYSTTSLMAAFAVRDKIYIVTSTDFWNTTPMRVFCYTPDTDSWEQKADFPGKKLQHAASFVLSERPFVFTGTTNLTVQGMDYTTYMWEYIVETDTWLRRSDFKGEGREWMVATDLNGIGYTGFGCKHVADNYFTEVIDWWSYDPKADRWSQRSILESWSWMSPHIAFSLKGNIYIGSERQGVWKYIGEEIIK